MSWASLFEVGYDLQKRGSPVLAAVAFVLSAAVLTISLLLLWWQVWARVTIGPEAATIRRLGRARCVRRDQALDVSRLWGRGPDAYDPRIGSGVGLSVLGVGRRGDLVTVPLDPRSRGFDRARAILRGWVREDGRLARDPMVVEAFDTRAPSCPLLAGIPGRFAVNLPLEAEWGFLLIVGSQFLDDLLDPDKHVAWPILSGILIALLAVFASYSYSQRRVIEGDSIRPGLWRRRLELRDVETITIGEWHDPKLHPAFVPAFTLSTSGGKGRTSLELLSIEQASAVFLALDSWVAARPELVQDETTHTWFAARGVLPRAQELTQETRSPG